MYSNAVGRDGAELRPTPSSEASGAVERVGLGDACIAFPVQQRLGPGTWKFEAKARGPREIGTLGHYRGPMNGRERDGRTRDKGNTGEYCFARMVCGDIFVLMSRSECIHTAYLPLGTGKYRSSAIFGPRCQWTGVLGLPWSISSHRAVVRSEHLNLNSRLLTPPRSMLHRWPDDQPPAWKDPRAFMPQV